MSGETHEQGTKEMGAWRVRIDEIDLQLVKLFELRANRDYAQLLVLSRLLMVAGAISTPSLLFGVMLIALGVRLRKIARGPDAHGRGRGHGLPPTVAPSH